MIEIHTNAHSSSWYLFLSLRGILESLIAAFSRKRHTCTDFHFSLSMGVQANILVKIYFRENVVVTKYLPRILDQHCIPLQFGVLFIIMQNLENFSHGISR